MTQTNLPERSNISTRNESARPAYLRIEDEGPHPIADVPLWSENYLDQIYDPEAQIGFWFHYGRAAFDPQLWNEVFIAYRPGDRFPVASSYSYGETPAGPTGSQLHYRYEKPFERWRKSFRGAAYLVSGAELRAGPFVQSASQFVEVDLVWENLGPAFDLGHLSSNDSWSSSSYEQHGKVRGHITFEGKRTDLNGTGLRDHSWDQRDFDRFNTHVWMHGQFPDGQTFEIFHIVEMNGRAGTHAVLGNAQGLRAANLVSTAPLITSIEEGDKSYDLVLTTESGERAEIHAEILQVPIMAFAGKSEFLFGKNAPPTGSHLLLEAQTKFT